MRDDEMRWRKQTTKYSQELMQNQNARDGRQSQDEWLSGSIPGVQMQTSKNQPRHGGLGGVNRNDNSSPFKRVSQQFQVLAPAQSESV